MLPTVGCPVVQFNPVQQPSRAFAIVPIGVFEGLTIECPQRGVKQSLTFSREGYLRPAASIHLHDWLVDQKLAFVSTEPAAAQ